jgi:hypothetical protein
VVWSVAQPLRRLISAFSHFQERRIFGRTWCSHALVGVLAVAIAGCNPVTDGRYTNEGAGVNLYTADQAGQIELLNQYFTYLCDQVGPGCGTVPQVVLAGMNDIDQRCDGYLAWLDAKRRDKEFVVAELATLNMAIHSIMAITGSSPQSLEILTAAFGLATHSYLNWASRLLITVENSTVQTVVYKAQKDFRETTNWGTAADRPSAIYFLRNYLRICMPMSIEANINLSTKLVLNGAGSAAAKNLAVGTTTPPRMVLKDSTSRIDTHRPTPTPDDTRFGPYETNLTTRYIQQIEAALCIKPASGKLGPAGSAARAAIRDYLVAQNQKIPTDKTDTLDRTDGINLERAANIIVNCSNTQFKNAYEVGAYGIPAAQTTNRITILQQNLNKWLEKNGLTKLTVTGKLDAPTRAAIAKVHEVEHISPVYAADQVDLGVRQAITD